MCVLATARSTYGVCLQRYLKPERGDGNARTSCELDCVDRDEDSKKELVCGQTDSLLVLIYIYLAKRAWMMMLICYRPTVNARLPYIGVWDRWIMLAAEIGKNRSKVSDREAVV